MRCLFRSATLALFGCSLGCGGGDDPPMMMPPPDPPGPTIETTAPVAFTPVYDAVDFETYNGEIRNWLPVDVAPGPAGELWVIQRAEREPGFDEITECTTRGSMSVDPTDDDCEGLLGSTVAITEPGAVEPATGANGRASLVSDSNSWHFMRRPTALAFGATELVVAPGDPGTLDLSGVSSIDAPVTFRDSFATCAEHWTGNWTDENPFIGPALWTADPAIYHGENGGEPWSNGSHIDMVHATPYCMGIAWERGAVYWLFNGETGSIDRYDFGAPHLPGHYFHDDATIDRYEWEGDVLARLPTVPSNLEIEGSELLVADTGNGRLVSFDVTVDMEPTGTFSSDEGLLAHRYYGAPFNVLVAREALAALWGEPVEPSGLALLHPGTLVIANHGTGHVSLLARDGTPLRTIDTGLGAGIGGVAVVGGTIYFVHMPERRVYRIDVIAE